MKKQYIIPQIRVVELDQTDSLLAGSLLNEDDTQNLYLEDDILDGDDLEVY